MSGRPRLGRMGEEEFGGFICLVTHFLPLMIQAGGRVIQGYPTEARRIRWGKVLHHLQRVYASQRSDHQLKHRWADLITREQDLLDHLGIMIGGTVGGLEPYTVGEVATFEDLNHYTANMTPEQVREFQRRAMRYQHILLVESGFRKMARRYHHECASGAWRAFPQGGPTVPTTATIETTTNQSQVAPPTAVSVDSTSAGLPGPSIDTGAGQPTQTSYTATQTATTPAADPAAFNRLEHKMDKVLRKGSHLSQDMWHIKRRVKDIKRTPTEGQPLDS
ncbi:hypothetical protein NDU88_007265 [Pleurodeles waltl]|uniref:Uncharacterized protein n=1 Tax=Pleurodeles waltl TaxID=8319 RepID=A0AAV7VP86_PLEWA|nr:hypothetical protein NDU88_007265 [Pleurodeles waltl]